MFVDTHVFVSTFTNKTADKYRGLPVIASLKTNLSNLFLLFTVLTQNTKSSIRFKIHKL